MMRINIKEQVLNIILLLLMQLPLIHRITLFNIAFGFFYVGFLLLLPRTLSKSYLMIIGFLSGLLVDIFTNTLGIHASASVLTLFLRNFWLDIVYKESQELFNLNIVTLKKTRFLYFIFPLVFVHHFTIFIVENGGFHLFGMVFSKVFFSTIFSVAVIFVVNVIVSSNSKSL